MGSCVSGKRTADKWECRTPKRTRISRWDEGDLALREAHPLCHHQDILITQIFTKLDWEGQAAVQMPTGTRGITRVPKRPARFHFSVFLFSLSSLPFLTPASVNMRKLRHAVFLTRLSLSSTLHCHSKMASIMPTRFLLLRTIWNVLEPPSSPSSSSPRYFYTAPLFASRSFSSNVVDESQAPAPIDYLKMSFIG
ncbi:hypothetical protein SOVF_048280 [Spinacia oleracea]|nr:hypothetical protein SOVF_048280 [Spinacia oleracea]